MVLRLLQLLHQMQGAVGGHTLAAHTDAPGIAEFERVCLQNQRKRSDPWQARTGRPQVAVLVERVLPVSGQN